MAILFAELTAFAAPGTVYEGKVVGVADGDTLTLLTADKRQIKVRFAKIDAPEKKQAFGKRAKQTLSELVFGKQVRVVEETTGRYARVVGHAYFGQLHVDAGKRSRVQLN